MINAIEKRNGQPAVPANISVYLTLKQERALLRLCKRGWRLLFIRRPLFREARPILVSKCNRHFSVLDSDGSIKTSLRLAFRE